jgi:WD40 repeat protein
MAAAKTTVRTILHPKTRTEPRSSGAIVAKDTKPLVKAVLVLGDQIIVTNHGPLARDPGNVVVRRRDDFKVVRQTKGSSGAIVPFGNTWLTEGLHWKLDRASTDVLDQRTLKVLERHAVRGPFLVVDEHRWVAATPPRGGSVLDPEPTGFKADPKILRASWVKLPSEGGLVEIDAKKKTTSLVVASTRYDDFRFAALSTDRKVVYAATSYARVIAVRLADRKVLWERPPVENCTELSVNALALSPDGDWLALAGSSRSGFDHLMLDTRTGGVKVQVRLRDMINRARIAKKPTSRIDALAFHPDGWLAAGTNSGVVVELLPSGQVSAFLGASRGIEVLAFADDGCNLIVGGAEPNLRVWPVDLETGRVKIVTTDDPQAKKRTRVIMKA